MVTRFDRVVAFTEEMRRRGITYYAGGGDNDHDGTPDRADYDDGNGVDCSGHQWGACAHAWKPLPPPFPLSSTAGYAFMGLHRGWIVPLGDALPGDLLIHDKYGNPYASNGPRGHGEILVARNGATWRSAGSAGSKNGVNFYDRSPGFWSMAIRVPGMLDQVDAPAPPPYTAEDLANLIRLLEELDVEHGMAVDVAFDPDNPTTGITLDRWGGIHPFGLSVKPSGGAWWEGKDVARRLVGVHWRTSSSDSGKRAPFGYIMDLNGGLHAFGKRADGSRPPALRDAAYWQNGKIVAINEA